MLNDPFSFLSYTRLLNEQVIATQMIHKKLKLTQFLKMSQ